MIHFSIIFHLKKMGMKLIWSEYLGFRCYRDVHNGNRNNDEKMSVNRGKELGQGRKRMILNAVTLLKTEDVTSAIQVITIAE